MEGEVSTGQKPRRFELSQMIEVWASVETVLAILSSPSRTREPSLNAIKEHIAYEADIDALRRIEERLSGMLGMRGAKPLPTALDSLFELEAELRERGFVRWAELARGVRTALGGEVPA